MRVRLSGGPNRQRFLGFDNKDEVKRFIRDSVTKRISFVKSGEADYIIVPNDVSSASKTASSGGGQVLGLSEFIRRFSEC